MGLDYAMVINLKRREDKYSFIRDKLKQVGFRDDQIIRFIAHDGQDYDSIESVHKAAIADGFEYLSGWTDFGKRSKIAWVWTWRCALREVMKMDKKVLLLLDDVFPDALYPYHKICEIVDVCCSDSEHGQFRVLQESWEPSLERGLVGKGVLGAHDIASILSAEGAKLMLDIASKEPLDYPLGDFLKLEHLQKTDRDYFYGTWHMFICDGYNGFESDLKRV